MGSFRAELPFVPNNILCVIRPSLAWISDFVQHVPESDPAACHIRSRGRADYPSFGQSSMPSHKDFAYTFENLTNVVEQCVEKL